MPIAKITGQGLAAIALSVGLLWGCVIWERVERQNAIEERARVLREVRRGLGPAHPVPVSDPHPLVHRRPHVAAG